MTPERWQRIREIHGDALDLPAHEREQFARRMCAGDDDLLKEVLSLLGVDLTPEDLEPPRPEVAQPKRSATDDPPDADPPDADLPDDDLPDDATGRRLGDYVLIESIGRGATGTVFRARDTKLEREVAMKVLEAGLTTTPSQLHRFRSEPQRIARLHHPHIVRIFASGHEGRTNWFSMELIDGHDLGRELSLQRSRSAAALLPRPGEPGHVQHVTRLGADVADALQVAHVAGIVHRDVKPQNLLLDSTGKVHLVDFGLSRDEQFGQVTMTGMLIGTVHYMSPEQTHAARNEVDARTDVYSLGVVLYEMLTLERPFDGGSQDEVWHRIRTAEPRPVRKLRASVPRDLELIVGKAMARDPKQRYASAAALADDLRRFLAFESIEAHAPTLSQNVRRFLYRHRRTLGTVLCGFLLVLLGWWWSTRLERHTRLDAATSRTQATLRRLDTASDQDLTTLRADLRTIEHDGDARHAELAAKAGAGLERLERTWNTRIDELIENGRSDNRDELISEAQLLRYRLAVVFADNPEYLTALARNPFAPRLTVILTDERGAPIGGRVSLRRIDPITGQPHPARPIGDLPIRDQETPIGYFRVRVDTDTHGVREFTRMLRSRGSLTTIERSLRQIDPQTLARLTDVDGDTIAFSDPDAGMSGINDRTIVVEPFQIERTEVSNRMYREFLDLHPKVRRPAHWHLVRPGSPEDDLPVAFISWEEAREYAEWCGLRLPTHAEWMLAARTTAAHPFPWGTDLPWRGNVGFDAALAPTLERKIELYFQRAEPVQSHPRANTASGLHHMLGNVWEWSESLQPERDSTGLIASFESRALLGGDWCVGGEARTLATALATAGVELSHATYTHGFRCARTPR